VYVGNASGYKDSRCKELEPGADDWTLLLQIDSDDNTRMMWDDAGMLYVGFAAKTSLPESSTRPGLFCNVYDGYRRLRLCELKSRVVAYSEM
jgi:hypothetical protein